MTLARRGNLHALARDRWRFMLPMVEVQASCLSTCVVCGFELPAKDWIVSRCPECWAREGGGGGEEHAKGGRSMIQRYVLSLAVPDEPTMKRSEFGAYVLHADVAALEVEAAELRSRNANLLEALRQQTEAAARATAKLADVEAEAEGAHNLIDTLSEILTNTANVLKGPPGELKMHSWHDLAEVARARLASFSAFADKHGEPRKVLGTLPVSKDGYVMGSGSAVWVVDAGEVSSGRIDWIGWTEEVGSDTAFWNVSECYSTETAALAAKEAGNGK